MSNTADSLASKYGLKRANSSYDPNYGNTPTMNSADRIANQYGLSKPQTTVNPNPVIVKPEIAKANTFINNTLPQVSITGFKNYTNDMSNYKAAQEAARIQNVINTTYPVAKEAVAKANYFKNGGQYTSNNLDKFYDRAYILANKADWDENDKAEAQAMVNASKEGFMGMNPFMTKMSQNNDEYINKWMPVLNALQNRNPNLPTAAAMGMYNATAGPAVGVAGALVKDNNIKNQANAFNAANYYAQQNHPVAYTGGQVAGEFAKMGTFGGLTNGIAGAGTMAAKAGASALAFGANAAYSGMGDVAQGNITPLEYAKNIGVSTAAGTASPIVAGLVGTKIAQYLVKNNMQTQFAEFARQTMSGMAGAYTRVGIGTLANAKMPDSYRASYLKQNPTATEDEIKNAYYTKLSKQMAIDLAVSFAFNVINGYKSSLAETTAGSNKINQAYNKMMAQWEAIVKNPTASNVQELADDVLSSCNSIKSELNSTYYAGQQQMVNEMNDMLDTIIEGTNSYMANFNADTAASGTSSGSVAPIVNLPSNIEAEPNAVNPVVNTEAPAINMPEAEQNNQPGVKTNKIGLFGKRQSQLGSEEELYNPAEPNNTEAQPVKTGVRSAPNPEYNMSDKIDSRSAGIMQNVLNKVGVDIPALLEKNGVQSIAELTNEQYASIMRDLNTAKPLPKVETIVQSNQPVQAEGENNGGEQILPGERIGSGNVSAGEPVSSVQSGQRTVEEVHRERGMAETVADSESAGLRVSEKPADEIFKWAREGQVIYLADEDTADVKEAKKYAQQIVKDYGISGNAKVQVWYGGMIRDKAHGNLQRAFFDPVTKTFGVCGDHQHYKPSQFIKHEGIEALISKGIVKTETVMKSIEDSYGTDFVNTVNAIAECLHTNVKELICNAPAEINDVLYIENGDEGTEYAAEVLKVFSEQANIAIDNAKSAAKAVKPLAKADTDIEGRKIFKDASGKEGYEFSSQAESGVKNLKKPDNSNHIENNGYSIDYDVNENGAVRINPDSYISERYTQKVHTMLNRLGYGMPSVKATDDYIRNGTYLNPDQSEGFKKLFGIDGAKEEAFDVNKAKEIAKKAEKHYGTTNSFAKASYITVNGKMLDFSEGQGYRTQDHREISEILDMPKDSGYSDGMIEFMNEGNIRIQTYGADIAVKPNKDQFDVLTRLINKLDGEFTLDISNKMGDNVASVDYPEGTKASRIINDIKKYFDDDIIPELSDTERYHFSTESEIIDTDKKYLKAIKENDIKTAQKMVDEAADNAFPKSKIRTRSGELMMVYHGTNESDFTIFDPKYIGMSSGDSGYFGMGFYFADTEDEAGFYGQSRIIPAYLNLENPFDWGKHFYNNEYHIGDSGNIVFASNFSKLFPEIAKKIKVSAYKYADDGSIEDVELTFPELAKEFNDVLNNVKFEVVEMDDAYSPTGKTFMVCADEQEYEYNGHKWKDYGYKQKYMYKKDAENKVAQAWYYMNDSMYAEVDLQSDTAYILDNNREFTNALKSMGYDGVIQSESGDEYVAFYPNQIKDASPVTYDDNGEVIPLSQRFNSENDDIRYSSNAIVSSDDKEKLKEMKKSSVFDKNQIKLVKDNEDKALAKEKMTAIDEEYLKAVEDGDEKKQEQMVAEAAKAAGFDSPLLYHGTNDFGFTKMNRGYLTSNFKVAQSYAASDSNNVRRIYDNAGYIDFKESPIEDIAKYLDAEYNSENKRKPYSVGFKNFSEKELRKYAEDLDYHTSIKKPRLKGVYGVYAKLGKSLVVDAKGRTWQDLYISKSVAEKYGIRAGKYNTNELVSALYSKGLDSLVVKNVSDATHGFDYNNENPVGDDYIIFNKKNIKSADPITYDDKGNVIPLSKRFGENEELRYSTEIDSNNLKAEDLAKAYDKLSIENRKKDEKIAALEKFVNEISDRDFMPTTQSLRQSAKLMKELAPTTTMGQKEIENRLSKIYTAIRNSEDGAGIYQLERSLAEDLVTGSAMGYDESEVRRWKEFKDILKGMKLKPSASIKAEMGGPKDFNEWRVGNFANGIRTSETDGIEIDKYYQVLNEWDASLFPEDLNDIDKFNKVREQLAALKPKANVEIMDGESLEEYTEDIVDAINESYFEARFKNGAIKEAESKLKAEYKKATTDYKAALRKQFQEQNAKIAFKTAWSMQNKQTLRDISNLRKKLGKNDAKLAEAMKSLSPEDREIAMRAIKNLATHAQRMTKEAKAILESRQEIFDSMKAVDPNYLPTKETLENLARYDYEYLKDMSLEDLADIHRTISIITHRMRTINEQIGEQKKEKFEDLFKRSRAELAGVKGTKQSTGIKNIAKEFWNDELLNPTNYIERMAGWNPESTFYKNISGILEQGERDVKGHVVKMNDILRSFKDKNKEWLSKSDGRGKDSTWYKIKVRPLYGYDDNHKPIYGLPVDVEITPIMKAYIAGGIKSDDFLRHAESGLIFPDKELYKKGMVTEAQTKGRKIGVSPEDMRNLFSEKNLDETEREYLHLVQDDVFDGYSKEHLNATSQAFNGVDIAMEEHYMPIYVNKKSVPTETTIDESIAGMPNIKHRVQSRKPIYVVSLTQAFEDNVRTVSQYCGMAIPIRNAQMLFNWSEDGQTMKELIADKWNDAGVNYIEEYLRDMSRKKGEKPKTFTKVGNYLLSNSIAGTFAMNPGLVLKQFHSYWTVGAVLGYDTMPSIKQMVDVDINLIKQYSPELAYRSMGWATPELADVTKNLPWTQKNKLLKITVGGGMVGGMDFFTVRALWPWCENYVKKYHPILDVGSNEYYQKVAEYYNEAVPVTQPMYDTSHRSTIMRESNPFIRTFTMFHTVPQQQLNMLRKYYGEMQYYNSRNPKSTKAKEARGKFNRGIIGILLATLGVTSTDVLANIVKNKLKSYRNDEGELTAESFAKKYGKDFAESLAGNVIAGKEILQTIEQVIESPTKVYDFNDPQLTLFNTIIQHIAQMVETWQEIQKGKAQVIESGGSLSDYADNTFGEYMSIVKTLASDIAYYGWGLPVSNTEKYLRGIVSLFDPELAEKYDYLWESKSKYIQSSYDAAEKTYNSTKNQTLKAEALEQMYKINKNGGTKKIDAINAIENLPISNEEKGKAFEEYWIAKHPSTSFDKWIEIGGTSYDYMAHNINLSAETLGKMNDRGITPETIIEYLDNDKAVSLTDVKSNGFDTYKALKEDIGGAAVNEQWHHIVEQDQSRKNGGRIDNTKVQNSNNIVSIKCGTQSLHQQLTSYYDSKQDFTNGKTVREWLSGKSFEEQWEFGVNQLQQYGVLIPGDKCWYLVPFDENAEEVEVSSAAPKYLQKAESIPKSGKVAMMEEYQDIGQYGKGNIDLYHRPQYYQKDGSLSTVNSFSFSDGDNEILIPTIVNKNGKATQLTNEEAIEWYYKTGEYLGKFKTINEANSYAKKLHLQQEEYYKNSIKPRYLSAPGKNA